VSAQPYLTACMHFLSTNKPAGWPRLAKMTGPFDIIFVDLEFSAYRPIVEQILDRGLLAEDGFILVDNGMSVPHINLDR
jgi:predicted O-methyltransferase YrrM